MVQLRRSDSGDLIAVFSTGGEPYRVKPMRAFPLSAPDVRIGLFQVMAGGKAGKELMMLEDLSGLDEESRRLINEELDRGDSPTFILKIRSVKEVNRVFRWDVETGQGHIVFDVQDPKYIYIIHYTLVILADTDGNRYSIDMTRLDPRSRALLEAYT